jgi:predicted CoA-binding protein
MSPTVGFLANQFLAQRRLAVVGVSRDPRDFSRSLVRELKARGYDVVPVHPWLDQVEGLRCYDRVQEIRPPVDGALLLTPPAVTTLVVRECAAAGIPRVWMHRGAGRGAVSAEAVAFCREQGMDVVEGACPWMFLPDAGAGHRFHGMLARLFGRHPSQRRAA